MPIVDVMIAMVGWGACRVEVPLGIMKFVGDGWSDGGWR